MKKLAIIIVVLFSIILFTNKTMAECPEGFSEVTVTIQINNCDYMVSICYICAVSTTQTIILDKFTKISPMCQQTWTIQQVEQALFSAITDPTFVYENLCDNMPPPCAIPPNPPQGLEEWGKNPVCWFKVREDGFVWFKPCETCYCVTKWRVCWDPVDGTAVETPISVPFLEGEGCDCSFIEPPDPIIEQQSTSCFRIPSECD
ncbi:MAG: hypothetical protein WCR42_15070 [bacterium]